jgi:release factor glutamine methyltransferase
VVVKYGRMDSLGKIREAREFLEKSGIDDAGREAELIISFCLGIDRVILYRDNPKISQEQILEIEGFLKRRSKREPLQYILGYTDFRGLRIKVAKGILIPRPETELLVEEAVKIISNFKIRNSKLMILDLCTGSGCIALALARKCPSAEVYGTDSSEVAIAYAKENAAINRIKNATFLRGNLFEPVRRPATFNLIVSNPPYIRKNDIKALQPEIRDWEPVEALDGGEDGLDYYRVIIPEARGFLKKDGFLMLELGIDQSEAVKRIALDAGFMDISLKKDYAGIERILMAKVN